MKNSYSQWQGHIAGSDALQATSIQRIYKFLSGLIFTFLAAYISVVLLHWPSTDRPEVDQSDFVMSSEIISEEC